VVTVVGVAYRGQIPLQDIRVDFQVEAVARPDARGFGVRKTVVLKGSLSETEQLRLRRAAEYCPVGQLFTKGALAIEDQVTCSAQSTAPEDAVSAAQVLQPPLDTLPTCAPGAVHGRYLTDTREYADSGGLQQEEGAGNRDHAQAAAAAGAINARRAVRRVVLHGTPDVSLVQAIAAALQHDPLSLSFRRGGVLLGEQIVVT
jgi:hypothetical protein